MRSIFNISANDKKGIALFLVMAIVFVLGIWLFFVSTQSIRIRQHTASVLEEEIALRIGISIAQCYWAALQDLLRKKTNSSSGVFGFKDLPLNTRSFDFTLDSSKLDLDGVFTELAKELGLGTISAKATWKAKSSSGSVEPLEAILDGRIELEISFKYSLLRGRSEKKEYKYVFPREFKLIQILPPIVSKFTMFVRTSPNPEDLNINLRAGLTGESTAKILTLINRIRPSGSPITNDPNGWLESGWIFFGGNKHLIVNIDGTNPAIDDSEIFLFFPPPRWEFTTLSKNVPTIQYNIPNANTALRVRVSPTGCFKELETDARFKDVLVSPGMAEYVPIANSSIIHLYGNKSDPTPTRVVGNVFARYILWSALIVDADGNEEADSFPPPERPDDLAATYFKPSKEHKISLVFPLPRVTNEAKYCGPIPIWSRSDNLNGYLDPYTVFSHWDIFKPKWKVLSPALAAGNPNDYVNFMTKISTSDLGTRNSDQPGPTAAYNSIYDIFQEGSTSNSERNFPPAQRFKTNDYPNSGTHFALCEKIGQESLHAEVDLNKWYDEYFVNKYDPTVSTDFFTHEFSTGAWLEKAGLLEDGYIRKPFSVYINDKLDLKSGLKLDSSAIIVAKGDIKIGSVVPGVETDAHRLLVLVSQTGNIECYGSLVKTALIAPKGTIISKKGGLDITGLVCENKLNIDSIKSTGGKIKYDADFDSSDSGVRQYGLTVILGPNLPIIAKK